MGEKIALCRSVLHRLVDSGTVVPSFAGTGLRTCFTLFLCNGSQSYAERENRLLDLQLQWHVPTMQVGCQ